MAFPKQESWSCHPVLISIYTACSSGTKGIHSGPGPLNVNTAAYGCSKITNGGELSSTITFYEIK